ncbi:glycosyltransferase [Halomicrobium urmianum]|uniref:glycosyltransferase n=1 Tax=Halomicrobium urmianum TaxID=1586233 RepID=UPI001CD9AB43|nr:glycosyltransferase [Halomicrobium urmianum]
MRETDDDAPAASVIVPVYNDPAGIDRTLSAVTDQTVPDSEYEVLAVDNGSTDGTRSVIEDYCRRHPDLVDLVVEDEVQGSYAARNAGIERARGEVFAFADADAGVERTWLASALDALEEADYVGFDVRIDESLDAGPVVAYNHVAEFTVERDLRRDRFVPTCCLAVRRRVVEEVGPFDERFVSSGDVEFGRRVHAAGFETAYEPSVTVYHPARNARELIGKYVRIGRGIEQRQRLYPERFEARPVVDWRALLPTISPGQLRDSADEVQADVDADLSLPTLAVFYLLDQLLVLATTAGRLAERVDPSEDRIDPAGEQAAAPGEQVDVSRGTVASSRSRATTEGE